MFSSYIYEEEAFIQNSLVSDMDIYLCYKYTYIIIIIIYHQKSALKMLFLFVFKNVNE